MPASFRDRKAKILADLSIPDSEYQDLSPKGSVDEGIRELISGINSQPGYVTTSSCAGRVAVYLEGAKGAKGGGWLFTSHDPFELPAQGAVGSVYEYFGLKAASEDAAKSSDAVGKRFVHFKFEPMVS
jgi:tRNA wybutosine-synthesizing protein 3